MKTQKTSKFFKILTLVLLANLCSIKSVLAQIIPDSTLGPESSTLTPNITVKGIPSDQINGGAIRGQNLFHSFQEFNVGEGRAVYFNQPASIENILMRVTGSNRSNILGTLGVLGNANLFLMNPQGIFLGPNSRLDVGGSFFATTANRFLWNQGIEFSTVNPQAPPLLAVNIPLGLGFRDRPGPIINQSRGNYDPQTFTFTDGLQVASGKTLALIGGNVQLQGGILSAPDGRVELGGLVAAGIVAIADNRLIFPDGVPRADTTLSNNASVIVTGSGRGSIAIATQNLDLLASSLNAGILPGWYLNAGQPGTIDISATGTVSLNNSRIETDVKSGGVGDAGAVRVQAGALDLSNGAVILSGVRKGDNSYPPGQGNGGNIAIDARDRVTLSGENTAIVASLGSRAVGNGGKIRITVSEGSLSLTEGAQLVASTSGQGNGGKIAVVARDSVTLKDNSSIAAEVDPGGLGNSGNIAVTVTQGSLSFSNGAAIVTRVQKADPNDPDRFPAGQGNGGNVSIYARDAVTLNQGSSIFTTVGKGVQGGKSGDISIEAGSLSLSSGTQITSATSGSRRLTDNAASQAGNITIQVRDRVALTNPGTSINAEVDRRAEGGLGGNINITARSVSVTTGARISASSQTAQPDRKPQELRNNAGSITIQANQGDVRLAEGLLEANTQAGKRASITVQALSLQMRHQSNIVTNANGTNGGNITIATGALAGLENSNITANAIGGAGGAIQIETQGLFRLQPRSRAEIEKLLGTSDLSQFDVSQLPGSNIIAISQTDPTLSGVVAIAPPTVDPTAGLVELPQEVVDPAALIAQNPCDRGRDSEFTITGKGGLPTNPSQPLNHNEVRVGLAAPASSGNLSSRIQPTHQPLNEAVSSANIIPTRGWIRNQKGEVILVEYDPTGRGANRQRINLNTCQPSQR